MKPVRILCSGLDPAQRDALACAATADTAPLHWLDPEGCGDGAPVEADLWLHCGRDTQTLMPAAQTPAIALALPPDEVAGLAARHPLLYSSPNALPPTMFAQLLPRLLGDGRDMRNAQPGAPRLAPGTLTELQQQFCSLSRALLTAGATSVQLHLATHRVAPILVLGPGQDDVLANTHAEGIAAIALRSGDDIGVDRPADDPRVRAGLDHPQHCGELPIVVLALGTRLLDASPWHIAVSLRAPGQDALRPLLPLTRALVDALWPRAEEVDASTRTRLNLYRPAALAALQHNDSEPVWPAFAPSWTRGYARLWRWPLLLAPLLLWLPIAPRVSGSAEVIHADAPPVASPIDASVSELPVRHGARVRRGDVLLRLRDPAAELQLEQAWSDYRAVLRQALRAPEDGSLALTLAQQWERVLSARGRRELAVLAPVDGQVVELPAGVGNAVAAGATLARVQPPHGRMMVALQLPLRGRAQIEAGAHGWLRLDDGSEHALRVHALGAVQRDERANATRQAWAELSAAPVDLLPGQRGSAHFALPSEPLYRHLWQALGDAP